MPSKIVWGITGSGDLISEIFEVMEEISKMKRLEITAVLSKAAVTVLKWYKLNDSLDRIADRIMVEKDANTPFIVGPLQTGEYDALIVAPATANTVAKIVNGIADTIITNSVSQTNKTSVDIFILPVDQKMGTTTTILPGGKKLDLSMRDVDVENTNRLRKMKGIVVLEKPKEIKGIVDRYR
jgi:archaeoflavoprotein AfpA